MMKVKITSNGMNQYHIPINRRQGGKNSITFVDIPAKHCCLGLVREKTNQFEEHFTKPLLCNLQKYQSDKSEAKTKKLFRIKQPSITRQLCLTQDPRLETSAAKTMWDSCLNLNEVSKWRVFGTFFLEYASKFLSS